MTHQEARDELTHCGIQYSAKALIESAKNDKTAIELAFKRGAEVKAFDHEGHTARWFALRYHHAYAAKIIEQAIGNINQPDPPLLPSTHSVDAQRAESPDTDAAELMRQVGAAYHSLSTYCDKGTSIDRVNGRDGAYEIKVDFETLFKRPGKLRFAWTLEYSYVPGKQQNVIWSDGATAWSSYSFHQDKPRRVKDLGLAVAGAIAVSRTTAHTIPRLLTDDVPGIRLDELQGLKITGNDTADGVECLVVVWYFASGGERKIWVGRKDHLIRRIEERSKNGTREEVRRQIVVDQDIADSRFSEQGR